MGYIPFFQEERNGVGAALKPKKLLSRTKMVQNEDLKNERCQY